MKQFLVLVYCLLMGYGCIAQEYTVKAYKSIDDYKAKKYELVKRVRFEMPKDERYRLVMYTSKNGEQFMSGYYIVAYEDTLYLNCGKLFPQIHNSGVRRVYNTTGYGRAFVETSRYICFRAAKSNAPGFYRKMFPINLEWLAFSQLGIAGWAIFRASNVNVNIEPKESKRIYNYVLDKQTNETKYMNRGVMLDMLDKLDTQKDTTFARFLNKMIELENQKDDDANMPYKLDEEE